MRPFYGRLKGKTLTPANEAFYANHRIQVEQPPEKSLLNPLKAYSHRVLEIGFGGGERLAAQLNLHPEKCFVGIEPFLNGMIKLLKVLDNSPDVKARVLLSRHPLSTWLPVLPDGFFQEIDLLFPDPWRKKRHHKRRLVQAETLKEFHRLLAPKGRLLVASDHTDYIAHIHQCFYHPFQTLFAYQAGVKGLKAETWPSWPSGWPLTRYAQKALKAGKPLAYFLWEKQEI